MTKGFFSVGKYILLACGVFAGTANAQNVQELIQNKGQIYDALGVLHPEVLYYGATRNAELYLQQNKISYALMQERQVVLNRDTLPSSVGKVDTIERIDLGFLNTNAPSIIGQAQTAGTINYFNGSNTGGAISTNGFGQVVYQNIYNHIDMVVQNVGNGVVYQFLASAGAKLSDIKFTVTGSQGVALTSDGGLVISAKLGNIEFTQPIGTQSILGNILPMVASFVQVGQQISISTSGVTVTTPVSITLTSNTPCPDRLRTVCQNTCLGCNTISEWATYYGHTGTEYAAATKLDQTGNKYMTGYTNSQFFPTQAGFQNQPQGSYDGYIIKFLAGTNARQFATYIGRDKDDYLTDIAIDAVGNVYAAGASKSLDLPLNFVNPTGAFVQPTNSSSAQETNGTLFKLNKNGQNLDWGTFFGGTGFQDQIKGIALDGLGNLYAVGVTNSRTGFPLKSKPGAYNQSTFDIAAISLGFIAKFNTTDLSQTWTSFLGGPTGSAGGNTALWDVAINPMNNKVVAVGTSTNDGATTSGTDYPGSYPLKTGGFSTGFSNWGSGYNTSDAVITVFTTIGDIEFSTMWGAIADDEARAVAVDEAGRIYFTGWTQGNNYITTAGPGGATTYTQGMMPPYDHLNAIITKFEPTYECTWSTSYGGDLDEKGYTIAARNGEVYVGGYTGGNAFPVLPLVASYNQLTFGGGNQDGFILMFTKDGERKWATFYGKAGDDEVDGLVTDGTQLTVSSSQAGTRMPVMKSDPNSYIQQYVNNGDSYFATFHPLCTNCSTAPGPIGLRVGKKADAGAGIALFPNPSDGNIALQISGAEKQQAVVEVYNVLGEKVYRAEISNLSADESKILDLTALSKGLYIVRVSTADQTFSKQISIE